MYWNQHRKYLRRKLSAKNVKVARPVLFNYIYTRQEFEHYSNELWKMMIEKKFAVRIHEIYPLRDVARAHTVRISHKGISGLADETSIGY